VGALSVRFLDDVERVRWLAGAFSGVVCQRRWLSSSSSCHRQPTSVSLDDKPGYVRPLPTSHDRQRLTSLRGAAKKYTPDIFGNIPLTIENFKIKFYTPILCSTFDDLHRI